MKLSEELKNCLDGNGCKDCERFEANSVLTCRGLLQVAYEEIKRNENIFPCNIGDTVYRICDIKSILATRIYECKVVGIKQEYNTISIKLHASIYEKNCSIFVDDWFDKCQVGFEFFLTQEQAENALKEMKESEGENGN